MTVVQNIILFVVICLIGVLAFVILKPLVVQIGIEKAMASSTYVALVSSQVITLSKAGQQDVIIDYKFTQDKNALYTIDIGNRKVAVCEVKKLCRCMQSVTNIQEVEASKNEDCRDACKRYNLEFDSALGSRIINKACAEVPMLFDISFSHKSAVGIHVKKTEPSSGSSISIEPITGD